MSGSVHGAGVAAATASAPSPSQRSPSMLEASFSDSLRRLVLQSVDLGHSRIELLLFELGDERARLGLLFTRGLCAGLLGLLGVQLLVFLLIAAVWDGPWRLPVIAGLAAVAVISAVGMALGYRAIPASTLFESRRSSPMPGLSGDGDRP